MANDSDVQVKELWAGIEYLKTEVSRLAQENADLSSKYKLLEQATAWARPVQAKIEHDLQKEAEELPEELEEYNIIAELTELMAWLGRLFYLAGNYPLFAAYLNTMITVAVPAVLVFISSLLLGKAKKTEEAVQPAQENSADQTNEE